MTNRTEAEQQRIAALADLNEHLKGSGLPYSPADFVPPYFTDPNYVPPSRQPLIVSVASVTIGLAIVTVILRLYSRAYVRGHLGYDDWFIIPALLFASALSTQLIIATTHGAMGTHIYDTNVSSISFGYPLLITAALLYATSLMFIKLSLLSLIHRLSRPATRTRHITIAFIVYNVLFWVGACFTVAFQCMPISAGYSLYTRTHGDGVKCLDQGKLYMTLTAMRVVFDFGLTILPVPMIMGLMMSGKQKFGVIIVWIVGLLASVACVVRLPYTRVMTEGFDITWNETPFFVLGQLETSLAIICASVPGLKPLFSLWFPRIIRSITSSTSRVGSFGSGAQNHYRGWRRSEAGVLGLRELGSGNESLSGITAHEIRVDNEVRVDGGLRDSVCGNGNVTAVFKGNVEVEVAEKEGSAWGKLWRG